MHEYIFIDLHTYVCIICMCTSIYQCMYVSCMYLCIHKYIHDTYIHWYTLVHIHFIVGRQAIVRRYKVLLNVKIISITSYFSLRFSYRLVFVVFYLSVIIVKVLIFLLQLLLFNSFRPSSSFVGFFKKIRGDSKVKLGFYSIVLYLHSKSCKASHFSKSSQTLH